MNVAPGSADQFDYFAIVDADGVPAAAATLNANIGSITLNYKTSATGATTATALTALASGTTAHTDNRAYAYGPGVLRVDFPDAPWASGASGFPGWLTFSGALAGYAVAGCFNGYRLGYSLQQADSGGGQLARVSNVTTVGTAVDNVYNELGTIENQLTSLALLDAQAVRDAMCLNKSSDVTGVAGSLDALVAARATQTSVDALVTTLVASIQDGLLNEADGKAVLQGIADKIAADWVAGDASPVAIVTAILANATIQTLLTNAGNAATRAATILTNLADTPAATYAKMIEPRPGGIVDDTSLFGNQANLLEAANTQAATLAEILEDTGETLLAAIEAGGGGGVPVYPKVIHPARVWSYDDRSRSRPVDIVTVRPGFAGRLAFEPPLNAGAAVATVTGVTLNNSATGISEAGPSGDYSQATFKTAAIAAGTYEVRATVTTTDGETLPLAATLKVE